MAVPACPPMGRWGRQALRGMYVVVVGALRNAGGMRPTVQRGSMAELCARPVGKESAHGGKRRAQPASNGMGRVGGAGQKPSKGQGGWSMRLWAGSVPSNHGTASEGRQAWAGAGLRLVKNGSARSA